MKRTLLTLAALVVAAIFTAGCGGAEEGPVVVANYQQYSDAALKFGLDYPEGWAQSVVPASRAVFYSSKDIESAFVDFQPAEGARGGKIEVMALNGGEETVTASIDSLRELITDPQAIQTPEKATVNGMPATKISFGFPIGDTEFKAERYYVVKDSMTTYIEIAVYGTFDNYKEVFQKALSTFKPGEHPAVFMANDTGAQQAADSDLVEAPTTPLQTYSGTHFSIGYPSNFDQGSAGADGAISATVFSGARNDSYYQVDVFDSKGLSLEKIAEQNKKKYGNRAPASASVAGQKAVVFTYSGGKDVSSRAYFFLAGGKLFRITTNWYTPQAELYQPVFQQAIGSFKAK